MGAGGREEEAAPPVVLGDEWPLCEFLDARPENSGEVIFSGRGERRRSLSRDGGRTTPSGRRLLMQRMAHAGELFLH